MAGGDVVNGSGYGSLSQGSLSLTAIYGFAMAVTSAYGSLCPRECLLASSPFFNPRWPAGNQLAFNGDSLKKPFSQPAAARRDCYRVRGLPLGRQTNGNAGTAIKKLSEEFGCLGVKVEEGEGKLPKIILTSNGGSEAELYLFGGCITSWRIPSGKDLLFIRPDAIFNCQKPISGGIPHCFPQFGPGPMQQHGFARNMEWFVDSSGNSEGNPTVTLQLKENSYSHSMWNFSFLATYKITLDSKMLSTELTIKNTDNKPFSFSGALHTYFRASVTGASVTGLKGCKTLNKFPDPTNPIVGTEEREVVNFPGFVDCIYLDAPNQLFLKNGLGDVISVVNKNWTDAVIWNPHTQMEACYRDFVCVENAKIEKVELGPGQTWSGEQYLRAN